jgi:hypothetical protein
MVAVLSSGQGGIEVSTVSVAKEVDLKRTRLERKPFKSRKSYRRALPLLFCTIILLFLFSPYLPASGNPTKTADSGSSIQLSEESVKGDGEHYLGLKPSPPGEYPQIALPQMLRLSLSSSADLSSQLPPVGDQGRQGSCVAWSTSYYYKSWSEKQEHTGWNLSSPYYQFSPSFMYNQINGGADNGATFTAAFSLLQNKGDVDVAEMPYNQSNYTTQPTPSQLEAAKPYRIPSNWAAFWTRSTTGPYSSPNNIDNVRAWLNSGRVLVMAIPVYTDFPNYGGNAPKAYYDYNGYSRYAGGHGVCICGYDDNINPGGSNADHRGGFKMVNSWGSSWNGSSAGYVYLSYDFVKRYVWEAWSMNDLSPDSPQISSLSAMEGKPADTIHIYGSNFGTLRRSARVSFNGTSATAISFTDKDITATVPAGATTGPLTVYDWEGTASNPVAFTVPGTPIGPQVTSITPNSGPQNTVVGIDLAGSNFQAGATVRLEGNGTVINAGGVNVVPPARITCTFDLTGAPPGQYDVVVKNPDNSEGKLAGGFAVNAACGMGAGASLMVFGVTMGLGSLLGTGGLRKRWRRKRR